jgi:uncharacterized protein involved in outer membrane biogenesis
MTRRRKVLVVAVSVPILLIVIVLLYLNFADLSGWKGTVERLASDAIGRELRISGEFQPEIGLTTRVVATDVSLANADWSDDPQMVSVDRLAGEIDLLSILFGPITIGDVDISGARVVFETNTNGRFNWALGDGDPSEGGGGEFEMVIGQALVNDIQLVYAGPERDPLVAELEKLEFTDDGSGMLDLELVGRLDDTPVEISGRLGTFIGLINASRVEHDLEGRFADAGFALRGTVDSLAALSGVEAEASFAGPDLSQFTTALGLEPIVEKPFAAELTVRQSGADSAFDVDASIGEMNANLNGTVDSLTDPGRLDVTVDASGPDVTRIGEIVGIDDLPTKPFNVSGRVRWAGFPLTWENVEARVGDNTLSAHGVLGKPPLMQGTNFTFEGGGPDISAIAALAGLEVPRERFAVKGRLVRLEHGIDVEKIKLEIGGITVEADGTIGDPPGYAGTALTFRGDGPNLARLDHLLGIALPAEPFSITGGLAQGDEAINLENVRARLGQSSLQVSGQFSTEEDFIGTDIRLQAQGSDASQAAALANLSTVPPEPFSIEGRARILAGGFRVHKVTGSLGSLNLSADGFIGQPPNLIGSDVQIHLDDNDLAHSASIAGVTGLPHDPFAVDARIRVEESGYRITGLDATVAGVNAKVDGFVGSPPELAGTDLQIDGRGPRFDALGPYLGQTGLPNVPFSVTGRVRLEESSIFLKDVAAEMASVHAEVDGVVKPSGDLAGTDLELDIRGPDFGEVTSLVAGFAEIPDLPNEHFSLTGGIAVDDSGFELREAELRVATSTARVTGRLGRPPEFLDSDLTIGIDGPDAVLFTAMTGVTTPVAPLELTGRVERNDKGIRFHAVTARLGDYRADVDGTLGALPKLIGTDFEIHASGPGTALIRDLAAVSWLQDRPFTLDGEFSGTPERFSSRQFTLTFGPSDIEGSFAVDITGKPDVQARLTSSVIDLSRLRDRLEDDELDPAGTAEAETPPADSGGLVISDEFFNLDWLNSADADVTIRVERIIMPAKIFRDFKLDFNLEHGRLEINRLAAVGRSEGTLDGSLVLEPEGAGYHLHTNLAMRQIRLDIPGSKTNRMEQPPIDIDIDLDGFGATPHELASSADGTAQLVIGKGVMDSRVLDLITTDLLLTLLNAFNPFAKQDESTELQCGVALLTVDDGVARLEPMAFQSDKMTMLGKGRVNLETEKLNFEWVTKPRKGIGVSASMITNPYIRLGGTLSNPSVQLKEAEAVVSTGAAVATLGLSLVAKGMYDRVTAEKKVCKKALEEIGRRADGSAKKKKK